MSHPLHTHPSVCYGLFDWPVCVSVVCVWDLGTRAVRRHRGGQVWRVCVSVLSTEREKGCLLEGNSAALVFEATWCVCV